MSHLILIVDDEKSVREMVSRLVEAMEYTPVTAESAEKALRIVKETPVELVITDLKMPGMDGLELSRKLIEQDPDRPVLLMTAFGDLDSARKAVYIGIYEYFTKPFDVNDVSAGIRRALERRRLVLENKAYQKDLERKVEERTRELERRLKELEARDELLKHLLSLQEPEETLGLAVRLARGLCACDAGALYCLAPDGELRLRAAAGFLDEGAPVRTEDLPGLNLKDTADGKFQESLENRTPVRVHNPDGVRRGYGIHSYGVLPVCRGEEVIALLEVGRRRKDALVGEADLEALQGFLPYVALSVADCKLQEELPEWGDNVEGMLKAADEWNEGGEA